MAEAVDAASSNAIRRQVGDISVTVFSDGILNSSLKNFIDIDHAECARVSGLPLEGNAPISVNAFLLEFDGRRALIDAGCSATMGPTLGKLPENLKAAEIAPESIDHILLTHIHPDHSNGLADDRGQAIYPNAEVIVSDADATFFLDRDPDTESHDFRRRSMAAAQRAFAPYLGKVRRISQGEVLPGISACPQPGHTLGHTGWMISSGNDQLLIWGDIVHVAELQFKRPDAALVFDLDPEMARKSRQRVFDWVATDRIQIAGAHLDRPGFGYVARRGTGYAFETD